VFNIALCSYVLSFGYVVIVLDIDSDQITIILEHHFCMFGNFMLSNVMVMKEVDNDFAHF